MGGRAISRLGALLLYASLAGPVWGLDASVDGVEDEVADNIRVYLQDLDASLYSRQRMKSEILRRVREAMRVYGYYAPRIDVHLTDEDPPGEAELRIEPGPRVTLETVSLELEGDAADDAPFRQAIDAFPLAVGDPLEHAPYDRLRSDLSGLALERGYFDWRFVERRMEVRPHEQSARLYLTLDSGPRYRFGEVTIEGSHIEPVRLRRMLPFTPGDPYLAQSLARYNQRLGDRRWFKSVSVRPRLREAESLALAESPLGFWNALELEGATPTLGGPTTPPPQLTEAALSGVRALQRPAVPEVPVDVTVTPADRHQFEVGLGYATDVGVRTRFAWRQPWINRYGHSLNHDAFFSAPEQRLTGTYTLPLADPSRDSYRFQYGLRQRDDRDTRFLETTVEAARRWVFDNRWEQSLYVRTTFEDFTQGDESEQVLLLYPGISWSRTRTRNPTFPRWGDRQRIAFEVSDDLWGSGADFQRLTGETEWIRMLGDITRVVGRLGLGAITTDEFDKVPPSLRFFTGGDRSVRGYAYESLAPRTDEGELTGGQHLLTASAELQYQLVGNWWGAAFVDTGDAFESWAPDALNTGAGLGVRWISPVGPVRLDIAHPFDDEDNAFRLHFAIGPEF